MIGSRFHPGDKEGITASTLENRTQQSKAARGSEEVTRESEEPMSEIFNNGRKGKRQQGQNSAYVPPARRRQEVHFRQPLFGTS